MADRSTFVLLAISFSTGLPVWSQQYTDLSGLVRDTSGAAIASATITLVNEDTGFRRISQSQVDGIYVIASLRPGLYKVSVGKEGFRTLVQSGIKLDVLQSARVDFMLPVGGIRETITVEESGPFLNNQDAAVGTLIGREWVERLPLNGRGLLSLLELAPGSLVTPAAGGEAGQFTVSGQRPNTHYFTLDGVSMNTGVSGGRMQAQFPGGSLPNFSSIGSLHSLISMEALQEFRVQTSTVTPEVGHLPGAQVALSSRAGSNELHGVAFHYLRHERLDANDWFANRHGDPRAALRLHDFGGTLGGPVRHNRTFFFLAYEGLRLSQPYTWRAAVPSSLARQTGPEWLKELLTLFPRANGPTLDPDLAEWTGRSSRPSRMGVGSVRFDHAVTAKTTLFARYNHAPSSTEFGTEPISRLSLGSNSVTVGLNVVASPTSVHDLRMNLSRSDAQSKWHQNAGTGWPECYLARLLPPGDLPCEAFFRVAVGGLTPVVSGTDSNNRQGQLNLVTTSSLVRGSHQVKFGADYQRLTPVRNGPGTSISASASSLAALLATQRLTIATSKAVEARSLLEALSGFAQDTWRANRRLTLTYGLRWELDPSPIARPIIVGPSVTTPPSNPAREVPIWRLRYTNFAPRAGAAYSITADGKTVLRAGMGLYYDPAFGATTDAVNGGPFNVWRFQSSGIQGSSLLPILLTYGFAPDLRLPSVRHWNATIERAWSDRSIFSASYIGSAGRDLLRREIREPSSGELVHVALATNRSFSDYHALHVQYRLRLGRRFQWMFSYAWSHSIDTGSADSALCWVVPGSTARSDRGSSDFDVRHSMSAAFSYDIPPARSARRLQRAIGGWSINGMFRARTGFPINILYNDNFYGLSIANAFRPDLVAGAPVWVSDSSTPGGKYLNRDAFLLPESFVQGTLGRNAISGFGMSQLDLAVRRDLAAGERWSLQLRVEAFNALNQANFADPIRYLVDPLFGQSTAMLNLMLGSGNPSAGLTPAFQTGGARSVQVALRFQF